MEVDNVLLEVDMFLGIVHFRVGFRECMSYVKSEPYDMVGRPRGPPKLLHRAKIHS